MRWISPNGREISVSTYKYRIDWNKKACSKPAQIVKDFLKKHCPGNIICEEFRIPGTRLRVDFLDFTRNIAFEVQGGGSNGKSHHETFNKFFHGNRHGFLHQLKKDGKKLEILEKNNITLIELWPDDLDKLSISLFKDKFGISF